MDKLLMTELTLDRSGLCPGQHVLDVGAGPGRLLIPAAKRIMPCGEINGLGIQADMLERLAARAAPAGITNFRTVTGDASKQHFPPDTFDVIYLCGSLGEIREREAALQQCFAVLK
jgi:ubiquinone/menaquinone biosynthesis C-methylase UbiE